MKTFIDSHNRVAVVAGALEDVIDTSKACSNHGAPWTVTERGGRFEPLGAGSKCRRR